MFSPVPTVFWSKLDGELPKDRMKSLTSSDSDFGKSLIVDNVHPDDAGRYECRAQQISHTVNVRVLGMCLSVEETAGFQLLPFGKRSHRKT